MPEQPVFEKPDQANANKNNKPRNSGAMNNCTLTLGTEEIIQKLDDTLFNKKDASAGLQDLRRAAAHVFGIPKDEEETFTFSDFYLRLMGQRTQRTDYDRKLVSYMLGRVLREFMARNMAKVPLGKNHITTETELQSSGPYAGRFNPVTMNTAYYYVYEPLGFGVRSYDEENNNKETLYNDQNLAIIIDGYLKAGHYERYPNAELAPIESLFTAPKTAYDEVVQLAFEKETETNDLNQKKAAWNKLIATDPTALGLLNNKENISKKNKPQKNSTWGKLINHAKLDVTEETIKDFIKTHKTRYETISTKLKDMKPKDLENLLSKTSEAKAGETSERFAERLQLAEVEGSRRMMR